jgi:hypothetical protein
MEEMHQSKLAPVSRWSRPGFVSLLFGRKPEEFRIDRGGNEDGVIRLGVGGVKMRWDCNGVWTNLNLDVQPVHNDLTPQQIRDLQRENAQLEVECEILLHMLTMSEMTKAEGRRALEELKEQIRNALEDCDLDEEEEESA